MKHLSGAAFVAAVLSLAGAIPVAAQQAVGNTITLSEPALPAVVETERQIDRIMALDDAGPQLNAVLAYDRHAALQTAAQIALPLAGRTVLVKDNIETHEWPTTAGSLALADNHTGRDAPLIARVREAGGVVLGKTNLSEWANFRSFSSSSGWSAIGGQTRNPHATDRSPCGSSSGSAVAVAAGFAWGAIGTETNGSITCPASVNGIVGFKPTVGMVSRTHVVPISVTQDTAGPLARTVADAALLLAAMAGTDPLDQATADADHYRVDLAGGVADASLAGVRIGVVRGRAGGLAPLEAVYAQALSDLERTGAMLVDVPFDGGQNISADAFAVLLYEFREGLNAYLQNSPAPLAVRSLAELIAFNRANAATELRWFDQAILELSAQTTDHRAYAAALANVLRASGPEGIERLLAEHDVALLVAPTEGPAWPIDLVLGDRFVDGIGIGGLAAQAGYPHLTVPMGAIEGLPVGLSFIAGRWADRTVLQAGAAFEQVRRATLAQPGLGPWSGDRENEPAVRAPAASHDGKAHLPR